MCCRLVWGLCVLLLTCEFPVVRANGQETADHNASVTSGTLNLILADKNGFVIAADSRMSGNEPFECKPGLPKRLYCDNSQKLFRTGKNSAMVIAGFAAGRTQPHSPLDLIVASLLRHNFGPCGQKVFQVTTGPKPTGEVVCAPEGMSGPSFGLFDLQPALTAVASLYDPEHFPQESPALATSWASIDDQESVRVQQQYFNVTWVSTSLGVPVPMWRVSLAPEVVVDHFYPVAEGISETALQILRGTYESPDPTIRDYYQKLHAGPSGRDSMTLKELSDLAQVILRETKKSFWQVGGPDQIGVFPIKGKPYIEGLSGLPIDTQLASRFMLNACLAYSPNGREAVGPCVNGTFYEDFAHPLEDAIPQFFLACKFRDVSVALDHNYFVRSDFDGVKFKYTGERAPFISRSSFRNCTVEVPEGVLLDIPDIASNCREVKVKSVTLDKDILGGPVRYQKKGASVSLPIPH